MFVLSPEKILIFSKLLFYYNFYVQPIVQFDVLLYGTACITALEPLKSKLNHLVGIICGAQNSDLIRAVSERNQIITVDALHLKKILKLLVIAMKKESLLEAIKSIIYHVDLEKESQLRSTRRSIKPANNATGCSSICIGVTVKQIRNIKLNYYPNFANYVKSRNKNKLENFISMCVQCYIQGDAELL